MSSIIPQIFWPAGEVQGHASSCGADLRALRRELLDHTRGRFARVHQVDRDAQLAWFEDWDLRLFRARPSCTEAEQDAWTELRRLRHGLQALVQRFERDEGPRLERLDQLLGAERAQAQTARADAHPIANTPLSKETTHDEDQTP